VADERVRTAPQMSATLPLRDDERPNWRTSVPFLLFHLVPLLAVVTGVTARAAVFGIGAYAVRLFFITAGYHRYFSHRGFKTSRLVQLLLAFGGTTAVQKGPLWWAGHHRAHHRHADTDADVHTPLKGFWHSHVGWILADRHSRTDVDGVRDWLRYPELRFLDRHDWLGPWALAIASFLVAGWSGLVVGFFLSTVLLWHATFLVNSLAHVLGRRRYATRDTSRNSALIAALTFGEGWHNNHHHFPTSARQGFYWWELDVTWYVLRAMAAVRLVTDLRLPSAEVVAASRTATGAFDIGLFRSHLARASAALARSRSGLDVVEALAARRAAVVEALHSEREALEQSVTSSLRAAEQYARKVRRAVRDVDVVTPPSA
jgi:stearoyl-CoA desaturase (Delta-9 desaturase)